MTTIYECIIQNVVDNQLLSQSVKFVKSEQQAIDWCKKPIMKIFGKVIDLQGIPIFMEREVE